MNNKKYIYFVEGPCEKQLIDALHVPPLRVAPGKAIVCNVIQNLIPKSQMLSIQPGTVVVLVFDTDKPITDKLQKNLELLSRYCTRIRIATLAQVLDFEDELVRSCNIKSVTEITRSKSVQNFKTDFCRMKIPDCRASLERHGLDTKQLWRKNPRNPFTFISQGADDVVI